MQICKRLLWFALLLVFAAAARAVLAMIDLCHAVSCRCSPHWPTTRSVAPSGQ
jgi:hypothetical protein